MVNARGGLASIEEKSLLVEAQPSALRRSFRRYGVGGLPIHRDMPRLGRDALEPAADLGKAREVVVAGMREMGVGVKRDVGDGVAIFHEIAMVLEVMLHHRKRAVALLHPVLERVLLQLAAALDQREPEVGSAHVGLDAVLLEEHPLQRFGAIESMFGPQPCMASQVPEDCVRFGEITARRGFEQRHLAVRILSQELRRPALALEDIDFDEAVGNVELREREAHLVAVARSLHGIERIHRLPSGGALQPPLEYGLAHQDGNVMARAGVEKWAPTTDTANGSPHLLPRPSRAENHFAVIPPRRDARAHA